eukprot:3340047-Alexandrium_andersonii.AAC.1
MRRRHHSWGVQALFPLLTEMLLASGPGVVVGGEDGAARSTSPTSSAMRRCGGGGPPAPASCEGA